MLLMVCAGFFHPMMVFGQTQKDCKSVVNLGSLYVLYTSVSRKTPALPTFSYSPKIRSPVSSLTQVTALYIVVGVDCIGLYPGTLIYQHGGSWRVEPACSATAVPPQSRVLRTSRDLRACDFAIASFAEQASLT